MTGKIFRGIFLVSLFTIILSMIFIIGVQYQFYDDAIKSGLKDKAYYIAEAMENSTSDYLSRLDGISDRITLIAPDGTVLYDNTSDAEKMDNHLNRPEVKKALEKGEGSSQRISDTHSFSTAYYAVRMEDGNIIRIADNNAGLFGIMLQLLPAISAVILITGVIALVLSSVIAQRIVKPINDIDLESPIVAESYEELSPLVEKINAQNRKINRQIKKLTRSKSEFETIADNMSEGLIICDRNCNVLLYNKSVAEVFKLDDEHSAVGKNIRVLNRNCEFANMADRLENGKHYTFNAEFGGNTYEILANPTFDDKGKHFGSVVIMVDISEKEKSERLRREFTANVSHELKTPLTSIYGISDMLKSGIVKPEDIISFSEDINRESARLITLVEDIIRLSRLDEGALPDMEATVDLFDSSKRVLERLSSMAKERNITLELKGENVSVKGNTVMIEELIRNLAENAVKYNKDNGSVTVSTGFTENKLPFLSVSDTGIGIPKKDTERIFERFYRVDKSHSRQSGGTGLGLSIVKHTAACHNAEIKLESVVDKGTEITVIFNK